MFKMQVQKKDVHASIPFRSKCFEESVEIPQSYILSSLEMVVIPEYFSLMRE